LSRVNSSIENSAISIGYASLASSISLAIVSASVGFAVRVILVVGLANERVNANSRSANSVASHWVRSIVGGTVAVRSTRSTTTIFHAILSSSAVAVGSTTRIADVAGANSVAR